MLLPIYTDEDEAREASMVREIERFAWGDTCDLPKDDGSRSCGGSELGGADAKDGGSRFCGGSELGEGEGSLPIPLPMLSQSKERASRED